MKKEYLLLAGFLLAFLPGTQGKVRLPAIINDHMVLQQNTSVNLWGWSEPAEKITIRTSWDTTVYHTKGSENADWKVSIKTPSQGGPYRITIQGSNEIIINDVLIGEVWLGSGQSNMQMTLRDCKIYDKEYDQADTRIRYFQVAKNGAAYPQQDLEGKWVVSSAEDLPSFSAVAYFFAKTLRQKIGAPVGLILSSWGGTAAEVWTPAETVEMDSIITNSSKKIIPTGYWPVKPGYAYNGMIHPLKQFNIAGTIWYQGENNTGTWNSYQHLFTTMIQSWRQQWGQSFPFYYVQIAPYNYGQKNVGALLREAQSRSQGTPNTGMVVVSDLVSDTLNVHPKDKKEVGERLARFALAETYKTPAGAYQSPQFSKMEIKKDKAIIHFDHAENGLVSKGKDVAEFYISGADRIFLPAKAKIKGNTVVVWNEKIREPVAVRFGFRNSAIPDLFSKEGLPVNLFRTDDWPE